MRLKRALLLMLSLLPSARADLSDSYNRFGYKLLEELLRENPTENVFICPASLAFALSMVANGAQGDTLHQLETVLGVSGNLNGENKKLLDHLAASDPKVALEIANSIWIDSKASVKPPFLDINQRTFNAAISNVDFQNPATVNAINDWVKEKTHDKIPTIVEPPLNPADRLILLDAVYFKGRWTSPFDKSLTQAKMFTNGRGSISSTPRMARTDSMLYSESDDYQAVELPYGSGALRMRVVLPRKSIAAFLPAFSALYPAFDKRKGTLELPKFKIENTYQLIPILQKLGLTDAFTPGANLRGISDQPLLINQVKQKTYVDVNEEGTEAAAVTGVAVALALVQRIEPPPFRMIVDRPFFVMIRDSGTGLILFLGAIQDPK